METIALIALAILLGGSPVEDKKKHKKTNFNAKQETYNASATRLTDIIHTDLSVRFDWEKQYLHGEAKITAKPYFKTSDQIILDAKGFDIHSVKKEGTALDINSDGSLNVRIGNQTKKISSGEVSININ